MPSDKLNFVFEVVSISVSVNADNLVVWLCIAGNDDVPALITFDVFSTDGEGNSVDVSGNGIEVSAGCTDENNNDGNDRYEDEAPVINDDVADILEDIFRPWSKMNNTK